MKYLLFSLPICLLIGCSSIPQTTDVAMPKLLVQAPLPEIPESIVTPPRYLDMQIFVREDGSVEQVRFLTELGDKTWDSLAIERIKQWRFAPARIDDKPIRTWTRFRASIKYAVPEYFFLGEILCSTQEEADSIYEMLSKGRDFEELALQRSGDLSKEQNGILGKINIYCYPDHIRKVLAELEVNGIAKPVQYGDRYAIFKRLHE